MKCDSAEPLVHAYIDGELDVSGVIALEDHLNGCPQCRTLREEISILRKQLRSGLESYPAPQGLRERVALASASAAPATPSMRWQRRQILAMAASVAIAVLVSSGTTYWAVVPRPSPSITDEVVASHIRSLMADHLIDVASSDRHTVKPWFDGKLDVAPAVADLTAEGFPLVGGRLDYIGTRPVAALVYRHGKHFINLFVCPTSDGGAAGSIAKARTIRGYNVRYWTTVDIAYWAVSDVDPSALDNFRDLVQRATAGVHS